MGDSNTQKEVAMSVAKDINARFDILPKVTEDGEILIDSVDMFWQVRMILVECGFHEVGQSHEFCVFSQVAQ